MKLINVVSGEVQGEIRSRNDSNETCTSDNTTAPEVEDHVTSESKRRTKEEGTVQNQSAEKHKNHKNVKFSDLIERYEPRTEEEGTAIESVDPDSKHVEKEESIEEGQDTPKDQGTPKDRGTPKDQDTSKDQDTPKDQGTPKDQDTQVDIARSPGATAFQQVTKETTSSVADVATTAEVKDYVTPESNSPLTNEDNEPCQTGQASDKSSSGNNNKAVTEVDYFGSDVSNDEAFEKNARSESNTEADKQSDSDTAVGDGAKEECMPQDQNTDNHQKRAVHSEDFEDDLEKDKHGRLKHYLELMRRPQAPYDDTLEDQGTTKEQGTEKDTPTTKDTPTVQDTHSAKTISEAKVTPSTKDGPDAKDDPKAKDDPNANADPNAKDDFNEKGNPDAKNTSSARDTPSAQDIPVKKVISEAKDTPSTKETPEAKNAPEAKETPEAKDSPEAKDNPSAEDTPSAKDTPEAKDTPKGKDPPKEKDPSKEMDTPKGKDTPSAKKISHAEDTPTGFTPSSPPHKVLG